MKPIRETELGTEQFCEHCPDGGYWWPLTSEFWYFRPNGKTNGPCIACQAEHRARLANEPCCVPGCSQPRHPMAARTNSRCIEHMREYAREQHRKKQKRQASEVQP